jgi:hypothetical protein
MGIWMFQKIKYTAIVTQEKEMQLMENCESR